MGGNGSGKRRHDWQGEVDHGGREELGTAKGITGGLSHPSPYPLPVGERVQRTVIPFAVLGAGKPSWSPALAGDRTGRPPEGGTPTKREMSRSPGAFAEESIGVGQTGFERESTRPPAAHAPAGGPRSEMMPLGRAKKQRLQFSCRMGFSPSRFVGRRAKAHPTTCQSYVFALPCRRIEGR